MTDSVRSFSAMLRNPHHTAWDSNQSSLSDTHRDYSVRPRAREIFKLGS